MRVELPDGRTLGGTVPGVAGDVLRTVTYSQVSPRHRLAAWVRLLALTAAHPDRGFEAVTVGRGAGRRDASRGPARLDGRARRCDYLVELVDLYDRGMREPLPLYCKTSAAYASGGRAARRLRRLPGKWSRPARQGGPQPEHQLVLGPVGFDELSSRAPRADEAAGTWTRRAASAATRAGCGIRCSPQRS